MEPGDANRWLVATLPEPLLRAGWHDLRWWQWIALPAVFVAAWLLARAFGFVVLRVVGGYFAKHPRAKKSFDRLRSPIDFFFALIVVDAAGALESLSKTGLEYQDRLLHAGYLLAIFWLILRLTDLGGDRLLDLPQGRHSAGIRSLVPLGVKAAKVVIFVMGIIAALSELGYPVASLVAGLGVGGVALALAAQKTVENLFGSVSIGVDQPFRVGDFVRIDDVKGTVESIGLRSTRVRTLDRTVVTFPNGKLADQRVECITERDRIRFAMTLAVAHDTSADRIRAILDGCRAIVEAKPKLGPEGVLVQLAKIAESALEIEISAWFAVSDAEFAVLREEILLALLNLVEKQGSRLAYPTHVVRLDSPTPTTTSAPAAS